MFFIENDLSMFLRNINPIVVSSNKVNLDNFEEEA